MVCAYKLHSLYLRGYGHKGAAHLSTFVPGQQLMLLALFYLFSLILIPCPISFISPWWHLPQNGWSFKNILGPESAIFPLLVGVPCAPERVPVVCYGVSFSLHCTWLYLSDFPSLKQLALKKISLNTRYMSEGQAPVTHSFQLDPSFWNIQNPIRYATSWGPNRMAFPI